MYLNDNSKSGLIAVKTSPISSGSELGVLTWGVYARFFPSPSKLIVMG